MNIRERLEVIHERIERLLERFEHFHEWKKLTCERLEFDMSGLSAQSIAFLFGRTNRKRLFILIKVPDQDLWHLHFTTCT